MTKVQGIFLNIMTITLIAWLTGCAGMQKDMGYQEYTSPDDWAAKTMTGPYLPLAKEAGVWSETKKFAIDGGEVGVQSKFVEQQGTTCTFEVKFINNGTTQIGQRVSLSRHNIGQGYDHHNEGGKEGIYAHRMTPVSVEPGKAVWYEMEKRECPLNWGTTKEMTKCAACSPALVFVK